jgi:hypothetical protein
LRQFASNKPALAELIDEEMEEFLKLFPEQHWRNHALGGSILCPPGDGAQLANLDIMTLLRLTHALKNLRNHQGFDKLIAGFRNLPQVLSTCFEVTAADFCATRAISNDIEFAPPVLIKGKFKHPEFLWRTTLGNLYVECKRGAMFEHKLGKKINRLRAVAFKAIMEAGLLTTSKRLDILVSTMTNHTERRLKEAIKRVSAADSGGVATTPVDNEEVHIEYRERGDPIPNILDSITATTSPVPAGATSFKAQDAPFFITMSTILHWKQAAGALLREANQQLPPDCAGAVFLKIGSPQQSLDRISSLFRLAEYVHIAWVAAVSNIGEFPKGIWGTWRGGQPFDDSAFLTPLK